MRIDLGRRLQLGRNPLSPPRGAPLRQGELQDKQLLVDEPPSSLVQDVHWSFGKWISGSASHSGNRGGACRGIPPETPRRAVRPPRSPPERRGGRAAAASLPLAGRGGESPAWAFPPPANSVILGWAISHIRPLYFGLPENMTRMPWRNLSAMYGWLNQTPSQASGVGKEQHAQDAPAGTEVPQFDFRDLAAYRLEKVVLQARPWGASRYDLRTNAERGTGGREDSGPPTARTDVTLWPVRPL